MDLSSTTLIPRDVYELVLRLFLVQQGCYEPLEVSGFLTHWMPQMKAYPYCRISFLTPENINDVTELIIDPTPHQIIRVFMIWEGLCNLNDTNQCSLNEDTTSVCKENLRQLEEKYHLASHTRQKQYRVTEWGGLQLRANSF